MRKNYPTPFDFRATVRRSVRKLLAAGLLLAALTAQAQQPMECVVLSAPAPTNQSAPSEANPPGTGSVTTTACADVQNIRVNVHFMQHDDGSGNFGPNGDGRPGNPPNTGDTGYDYAQGLLYACNSQMDQNARLNLAPGSAIWPLPGKRVKWVLDGVYFHQNSYYRDGAYNDRRSPPLLGRVYDNFCVRADSVINIFLVEEEEWPYTINGAVATPLARGYVYNISQCGTSPAPAKMYCVISSPWTKYILANTSAYDMATTLNHELCHLLGLNHPFQGLSTCSDAPAHPNAQLNANPPVYTNCWNLNSPPGPDCDVWSKVSNNLMDYNAAQSSLSLCQIGISGQPQHLSSGPVCV